MLKPERRNDFVDHVLKFHLIRYVYGGDDPFGIDCSGLIVEGFKAIGHYSENQDRSANGIYKDLKHKAIQRSAARAGCLVFFLNLRGERKGQATHVGVFINDYQIIHAAGGGSETDTPEEAIKENAYVKIRDVELVAKRRSSYQTYIIVDPFS